MRRIVVIEDEAHAESHGEFGSRAEAVEELRRLASLPWDQPPSRAPCRGWRECGRRYELLECDVKDRSRVLQRAPALDIDARQVTWHIPSSGRRLRVSLPASFTASSRCPSNHVPPNRVAVMHQRFSRGGRADLDPMMRSVADYGA